ncbi:hypothetical protein U0070_013810 [Myodes glareolus]|uniref:Uncharacterized protein n=1 Tax=Myodes glareolus TaxID=447135 RepID=A0AAW0GWQ3_MYOGA
MMEEGHKHSELRPQKSSGIRTAKEPTTRKILEDSQPRIEPRASLLFIISLEGGHLDAMATFKGIAGEELPWELLSLRLGSQSPFPRIARPFCCQSLQSGGALSMKDSSLQIRQAGFACRCTLVIPGFQDSPKRITSLPITSLCLPIPRKIILTAGSTSTLTPASQDTKPSVSKLKPSPLLPAILPPINEVSRNTLWECCHCHNLSKEGKQPGEELPGELLTPRTVKSQPLPSKCQGLSAASDCMQVVHRPWQTAPCR